MTLFNIDRYNEGRVLVFVQNNGSECRVCARYVAKVVWRAKKGRNGNSVFFRFLTKISTRLHETDSNRRQWETEIELELLTRRQLLFSFLRGSFKSTVPMEGRDTKIGIRVFPDKQMTPILLFLEQPKLELACCECCCFYCCVWTTVFVGMLRQGSR